MTSRPWIQWAMMWTIFITAWWMVDRFAPSAPWISSQEAVHPLPLMPVKPLMLEWSAKHHLDGAMAQESDRWDFFDSLDLDSTFHSAFIGNTSAWFRLRQFFIQLQNAKQSKVDVYHWGDSQIEGDRITGVLRESWQSRWGGRGPGWVLPLMPAPNPELTTAIEGNIQRQAGFGRKRATTALKLPFFAVNNIPDSATWHVRQNASSGSTLFGWTTTELWGDTAVNVSQRHLPVAKASSIPLPRGSVNGLHLGSDFGVMIHNLPLRGASGTLFDQLCDLDWQTIEKAHPPDMIMLQFGGNVVPGLSSKKQALQYAKRMANVVADLRGRFPSCSVVFIGPSDMGKTAEEYPGLSWVVEALKSELPKAGALFWNLQEAMGGKGSMANWHDDGLARNDHVHFTRKGAREAAQRLEHDLMLAWEEMRPPPASSKPMEP